MCCGSMGIISPLYIVVLDHSVWIEWWYLCPLRGVLSYCIVVVDMHGQSITRCLADLYIVHIAKLMEIISPLYIVAMDRSGCNEWSD